MRTNEDFGFLETRNEILATTDLTGRRVRFRRSGVLESVIYLCRFLSRSRRSGRDVWRDGSDGWWAWGGDLKLLGREIDDAEKLLRSRTTLRLRFLPDRHRHNNNPGRYPVEFVLSRGNVGAAAPP